MWDKIKLTWQFIIIDHLLFTILFFASGIENLKSAIVVYFSALVLRFFFLLLLMELSSTFVVEMKRFLKPFYSFILIFLAGYFVLLFFMMQINDYESAASMMKQLHFSVQQISIVYPYLVACCYYLYRLQN